jgi:hypothetical protein
MVKLHFMSMSRDKPFPSHDPSVLHPGKIFYAGKWRSPEGVERHRESKRRYDASSRGIILHRRIRLGRERKRILEQLEALKSGNEQS